MIDTLGRILADQLLKDWDDSRIANFIMTLAHQKGKKKTKDLMNNLLNRERTGNSEPLEFHALFLLSVYHRIGTERFETLVAAARPSSSGAEG